MKKILHCLPGNLDVGGIERFIINVNNNLNLEKYRFDYIVHKQEKNFYEEDVVSLGGKIHRLPNKSKDFFKYKSKFKEVIKNYEIIHIHSVYAFSYFETKWAKEEGMRVVLHSHNSSASPKRKIIHNLLKISQDKFVDVRLSCSNDASKWMFSKKNLDKSIIINNGFDIDRYIYDKLNRKLYRKLLNFTDEDIVIGNTSRFSRQKNPFFLLSVFENLYKRNQNFRLILIGEGELKEGLEEKVEALGLKDVVVIHDGVENVQDYLNVLDVFIFPSLYEGLGISLLEAQINGLKCFVNSNIPEEAIICEENVTLNKLDDLNLWVQEIERIELGYNREVDLDKFQEFSIKKVVRLIEKNCYI